MAPETRIACGIVGVSGYSGIEMARLVARHPHLELRLAVSDKWAGAPLGRHVPLRGDAAGIACTAQKDAATSFAGLGLVFLCTPAEVSIELAPAALDAGARVVDVSGGFRLAADLYPRWYGFAHAHADWLAKARYSMPEATGAAGLREARLVANPGCYATAATLALLPLLRAGIVEPRGLVVDAKSGTTGAGRKATEDMSFSEVNENLRAYRVGKHQHTPEIEMALARGGAPAASVTFTPHLLPVRRGILATAYGRLVPGKTAADADAAVRAFAEGKAFVRVGTPEEVTLHATVGTNRVLLAATADVERGTATAFASLDNLVKGAAGQALQNANLMMGWPETLGLDSLPGSI